MKILLVGLGSIGQRHTRNLRATLGADVELLAYRVRRLRHIITADLRIEAGDVEARYGLRVLPTLDEALAERPDAVFITNPNSLHMPIALAAARAGCHLFIEKPISHSLDGVDELAGLVERKGLVCLVGYQWRFHPALAFVQACLAEHEIGDVVTARLDFGEYLPGWHPYEDYRQTHVARRELGGGVILAQIHDLDLAYTLFGVPRRVFAAGGHLSDLEMDTEDTASILMEHLIDGRRVPVHLHQDCVRQPAGRTYELVGSAGKIRMDLQAQTVHVFDGSGQITQTRSFGQCERNQMFLAELRHFLACLRGDERPVVGVRESIESLRMALAAKESIETGRVVDLM